MLISGINPEKPQAKTAVRGEYPNGETQEIWYEYDQASKTLTFTATPHERNLIVTVRNVQPCHGAQVVDTLRNVAVPRSPATGDLAQLKKLGSAWHFAVDTLTKQQELVIRVEGDNLIGTQLAVCVTI